MTAQDRNGTPDGIDADVARLEGVLRTLLDGHQRLGTYLEAKRKAIRTADIDRISALCRQEHLVVQRLAELEKQRLTVLGRLTEAIQPRASRLLTLREVAAAAEHERGAALLAVADGLREHVGSVRQLSAVIRGASESLNRHLTGIMQAVQTVLSGTTTYGSRGRIDVGQPLEHCVDVKS
ncbi:MAG: flagellar protein FlgN [Planctomycetota bacterium]|jgi:flagellar biosynthesis/type III secretory pathway chaperone